MSIFRRRLMMGGKKPIEYLEFEDRRVLEICAYRWGYTQNIQEIGGAGGVLDEGVIEGNNDATMTGDYVFAASYAISEHGSVPATASRTVQYRIELYVNGSQSAAGAPWEIATPADATKYALYIGQYNTAMTVTYLKGITSESWADASYWASQTDITYNSMKGCWECLVTVTKSCQYLRIGLRAAAGVSVSWKVVSVGVTKIPLGITAKQCEAVSSIGTYFKSNTIITSLRDLVYFTNIVTFKNAFEGCTNVLYIIIPVNTTGMNYNTFRNNRKLVWIKLLPNVVIAMNGSNCLAETNNCPVYVPDDLVDAYKAAKNWSQYPTRYKPMSSAT